MVWVAAVATTPLSSTHPCTSPSPTGCWVFVLLWAFMLPAAKHHMMHPRQWRVDCPLCAPLGMSSVAPVSCSSCFLVLPPRPMINGSSCRDTYEWQQQQQQHPHMSAASNNHGAWSKKKGGRVGGGLHTTHIPYRPHLAVDSKLCDKAVPLLGYQ